MVGVVLLAGITPRIMGAGDYSCAKLTCLNMKGVGDALKMFKLDNGVYPTTTEGLQALISNPNPNKYPNYDTHAYFSKNPKDSWGSFLLYKHNKGEHFELISLGADKKFGGVDDYRDRFYSECPKRYH